MGPPPLACSSLLAVLLSFLLIINKEIHGASSRSSGGSQQQQTPADFDCPEEFGYYAHPTDCTLYYVCVFGGALLESCTGGLMYSHELQTCDWPRNVGCAPGQISQPQQQHLTQKISQQPVSQQVDVPSRGRQRQQQIQIPKADLYTEEEDLGPAEELESDRQQRVYRGQPSTLGQVASDRDGLTHSNAIPVPSTGGRDKLSVVSYGAQQQYNRASVQPVQQQVYDTRGYNTSRYIQQQQYDPNYYAVYDEEAEQYKDIGDFAQYVQQNKQDAYARKKPSVEIVQQEQLQRASPYSKSKYSNQPENIYQSVTPQEYDSYSIQTNDDVPYRQVQTKTNNRFPEVKESVAVQGERRLITLPTEGTVQTNTNSNGGVRSEPVVTEGNVVSITPRKSDRSSASAEQRRGQAPSFAEQINALAPSRETLDPVAKVLEALSKSEEYQSDEASTERSAEGRSSTEESSESSRSSSLTVEELEIDFLKKLKSQSGSSEGSHNRFRFTPRSQSTQPPHNLDSYGIGVNIVQVTPTPNAPLTPETRSRQAKLVLEEITTPKPLIFRIPEAFGGEENPFERDQERSRSRVEGRSHEQNRDFNARQDSLNSRVTDNQKRINVESYGLEKRGNQYFGGQAQQRNNNNDAPNYDYRNRGHLRNNEASRQQSTAGSYSSRNADQVTQRVPFAPTATPLRITVAPGTSNDDDVLREQLIRQYNARLEESRSQQAAEHASRGTPQTSSREWSNDNNRQTGVRKADEPVQTTTDRSAKHVLIRVPVSRDETQPQRRVPLAPLSDYVNSNVNIMIDAAGRSIVDSSTESGSEEEQASEEARKPIAIRVPDSFPRDNDGRQPVNSREESYSRKPIRYTDSSEYNEQKSRFESVRGSSRFTPSTEEFENDELTNMTEEPRKPLPIRVPERSDATPYRSRNHKTKSREYYSGETGSRRTEFTPKTYQQEERRRIVAAPVAQHEPRSTESTANLRPIAIRVPDSIDLNQYRSREESPAAKVADSLTPTTVRNRAEEDSRQTYDQRPRARIPFSSREEISSEGLLKNRYEVATTLRPTRVLSLPTTPKPTRPPKKFRNGTQYSDLTLPIGTDMTDTNPSGPDPSIRVRPMSFVVPTTPGLTRGSSRHRGSSTYTVSPNEAEPPAQPRGTPLPQRGRPTLKPSTTVVGKAAEFIDIYRYPASRPDNVYPTPQVDKTAAKCRKDVCLLPDCYCGGKDVPGELTPEETPQIVLLTFDDSVNDLNKGLYSDLFEKGRVNPNGCPISATFYVSHEWTDYSQVQNLYATGHEIASHSVSHSFGEQFSQKKWTREIAGQREILAAYGGVKLEDIRGMRAPFLAVGGNKMFKMLYDSNFTYDSSMPVYENRPPSWPYTLDYKLFHDCMIPPCPTKSYPGVWEVPMVMWQDLNGGRCSMGDACSNPPTSDGVYKMLIKNFERHFTSNRAPFGLFYHAAWFTQPHHKEGFIAFLDTINKMPEVWIITNWQAIQWVRDPTPLSRLGNFAPFQCNYPDRPKKCNNPKVCNLWHKSGVRYMRTCQICPDVYPWTGKSGVRNSRVDNDLE